MRQGSMEGAPESRSVGEHGGNKWTKRFLARERSGAAYYYLVQYQTYYVSQQEVTTNIFLIYF